MKKGFYLLLTGESMSQIGNNLFDIAIMWYLYKVTTNALTIGIVTAIFNLIVLLNIYTGFLADKFKKTNIMKLVDGVQIGLMILATIIYQSGDITLMSIVLISFLSKVLGTFFNPAVDALIPQLVDRASLSKANGLNQGVQMVTQMIGMLLGGVMVAFVPLSWFMAINGGTFIISIIFIYALTLTFHEKVPKVVAKQDSKWDTGVNYIFRQPILKIVIFLALIINFTLGPVMGLDIIWVRGALHSSALIYSMTQIGLMSGVILGNILVNLVKWSLKRKLVFTFLVMGASVSLMALLRNPVGTIFTLITMGLAAGFINVSVYTIIQTQTPTNLLGRVSGSVLAGCNISMPLGIMVGGAVSHVIGIDELFLLEGLMALMIAIFVLSILRVPQSVA